MIGGGRVALEVVAEGGHGPGQEAREAEVLGRRTLLRGVEERSHDLDGEFVHQLEYLVGRSLDPSSISHLGAVCQVVNLGGEAHLATHGHAAAHHRVAGARATRHTERVHELGVGGLTDLSVPTGQNRAGVDGPVVGQPVQIGRDQIDHPLPVDLQVGAGHMEGQDSDAAGRQFGTGLLGADQGPAPAKDHEDTGCPEQERERHHATHDRAAPGQVRELPSLEAGQDVGGCDLPIRRDLSRLFGRCGLRKRLNPRGGQNHHETDHQQEHGYRANPLGQGEQAGRRLDDLQDNPGSTQIDHEDLYDSRASKAVPQ